MISRPAKLLLFAALFASSGCRDLGAGDRAGKVPPPNAACICAQACGVFAPGMSVWVDGDGQTQQLGACFPVQDEVIYEARAGCRCGAKASSGLRQSPNH